MKCKYCTNETDNTSGVCDECVKYPNYEDTEEGFTGLCYMKGTQGVDGSKYSIRAVNEDLVEIINR